MAFHRTIVARTGFVYEMIATLGGRNALIGVDGQWIGAVAEDEAGAIQAANDYFEQSNVGSVVAPDSTDAWDFTDFTGEIVIGWNMTADGWFDEDED